MADLENWLNQIAKKHKITFDRLIVREGEQVVWHPTYSINLAFGNNTMQFQIKGLPTGCGLVMMSGFTSSTFNDKTRLIFDNIMEFYKSDGAGTVIATLGEHYEVQEKGLMNEWGFKKLSTYNNWRHGSNYNQSLYAYSL